MKTVVILLSKEEWREIRNLKNKKGLTWRGILINWYEKNK